MSTMRLLLIEDNERLGQLIRDGLTKDGLTVDWQQTLEDGEATLEAAATLAQTALAQVHGAPLLAALVEV